MNIQIFGKSKCFDTKKAERYFKERRIKYQYIDLKRYGISKGELNSVLQKHPLEELLDPKHPDLALVKRAWRIPPSCARPSCATGSSPLWGTRRKSGRLGSKAAKNPLAKLEQMYYNGGITGFANEKRRD